MKKTIQTLADPDGASKWVFEGHARRSNVGTVNEPEPIPEPANSEPELSNPDTASE
jgi:hypothetical protein